MLAMLTLGAIFRKGAGMFDKKATITEIAKLTEKIAELTGEISALKSEKSAIAELRRLRGQSDELRKEIVKLQIEKDKLDEDNARKLREVEHKVGLEKMRQTHELEAAKKDAELTVREESIVAQKEQFEAEMEFRQKQFDGQIDYLKILMKEILGRLPSVQVDRQIKEITKES